MYSGTDFQNQKQCYLERKGRLEEEGACRFAYCLSLHPNMLCCEDIPMLPSCLLNRFEFQIMLNVHSSH